MKSSLRNKLITGSMPYSSFAVKSYHLAKIHGFVTNNTSLGCLFHTVDPYQGHANLVLTKNYGKYPWDLRLTNYSLSESAINILITETDTPIFFHNYYLPIDLINTTNNPISIELLNDPINAIVKSCHSLYREAKSKILIHFESNSRRIIIPNYFLGKDGLNGFVIDLKSLIKIENNINPVILHANKTHTIFEAHPSFLMDLSTSDNKRSIGRLLMPKHFGFSYLPNYLSDDPDIASYLLSLMPSILDSKQPFLDAQIHALDFITHKNIDFINTTMTKKGLTNTSFLYLSGLIIDPTNNHFSNFTEGDYYPYIAIINQSNNNNISFSHGDFIKILNEMPLDTDHQIDIEKFINSLNNEDIDIDTSELGDE